MPSHDPTPWPKLLDIVRALVRAHDERNVSSTPRRDSILDEAAGIVNGARQGDYGKPEDCFATIAALWSADRAAKYGHQRKPDGTPLYKVLPYTPGDVARMMMLLKCARLANRPTRDGYVDIAGYAECGARCEGFSHGKPPETGQ